MFATGYMGRPQEWANSIASTRNQSLEDSCNPQGHAVAEAKAREDGEPSVS